MDTHCPLELGWPTKLGITGLVDDKAGPPSINFGGTIPYTTLGNAWDSGFEANNRYQFLDDLTWITGRHTVKVGFEYRYMQFPQHGWAVNTGGIFGFNSVETGGFDANGNSLSQTGDAFASFLLGQVNNANFTIPAFYTPVQKYMAPWINDDFKVTPKLTLTLGLRWDLEPPLTEQHNRFSTFSPNVINPGAGNTKGGLLFLGSGPNGNGSNTFETSSWNWGPRFGFAYRLTDKNVIRGGYGIYYSGVPGALAGGYPVTGFQTNPTAPNLTGGVFPAFYWDNGFPAANVIKPPVISPSAANGTSVTSDPSYAQTMPRYQSWSLVFDRQISANTAIDIAYVGNHGTRLINSPDTLGPGANMNNPSILALGSTLLLSDVNSPAAQAAGIKVPYAGFTGDVAQSLRPYPQFQEIVWRNAADGQSHYNALQVTFDHRLSQGFQMRVGYTWSKLINDGAETAEAGWGTAQGQSGPQNPVNFQQGERGLSIDDVPQYLGLAWIYELPFGQNQRFGSSAGGALNKLISGWKLSATQVYQSGRPLSITMDNNLGGLLFNDAKRPNKVGPGLNANFTGPQTPYLLLSGWADPGALSFGNASRTDPVIRGFGYFNEDMDLMKDTHLTERTMLRFEAEAGNLFNRVDFCPPQANWSNASAFGTVGSQCNIPRRFQFGMTLSF